MWVMAFCHRLVENAAQGKCFDYVQSIENNQVGLLLGTSKMLSNGYQNKYFFNRIDAVMALYNAGKIKVLVISGDNGHVDYNEPEDMKQELVKRGFPSHLIFLDYAGFRTFDSVYRMYYIFGQTKFLVVSQEFHNSRAIYIAEKLGLEAQGYNAKDVSKYYGLKTMVRERFARTKLFIDLIIGQKPKFLGEKINIDKV